MRTFWIVNYGPDSRHLMNVNVFDTLKEAKEFSSELSKAWELWRHNPESNFGTNWKRTKISENIL